VKLGLPLREVLATANPPARAMQVGPAANGAERESASRRLSSRACAVCAPFTRLQKRPPHKRGVHSRVMIFHRAGRRQRIDQEIAVLGRFYAERQLVPDGKMSASAAIARFAADQLLRAGSGHESPNIRHGHSKRGSVSAINAVMPPKTGMMPLRADSLDTLGAGAPRVEASQQTNARAIPRSIAGLFTRLTSRAQSIAARNGRR